jgi:hypothetical protein
MEFPHLLADVERDAEPPAARLLLGPAHQARRRVVSLVDHQDGLQALVMARVKLVREGAGFLERSVSFPLVEGAFELAGCRSDNRPR